MTQYQDLPLVSPAGLAEQLHREPWFVWLDSEQAKGPMAKWSFMSAAPTKTVQTGQTGTFLNDEPTQQDLFGILRAELAPSSADMPSAKTPPFQGGWIGYLTYDFGAELMDWRSRHTPPETLAAFGYYPVFLAWDHEASQCHLVAENAEALVSPAADLLRSAHQKALAASSARKNPAPLNWTPETPQADYLASIEKVQTLIAEGDIYQANISQTWTAPLASPDHTQSPAFTHYLQLRRTNPAPFSAYLDFPAQTIGSTSPERFLRVENARVEARPIKGTIQASTDKDTDAARKETLLSSIKDRAENIMIVDLLRNDLSKVCCPHTVEAPDTCKLESYEGLHHLVSTVTGELKPGHDALDLVAAAFPGGSITGAPKLRAMEIIDALETEARGIYCGSIGYIGRDGTMDLSIAIRTVSYGRDQASLKAGGGITHRSDPQAEYAETLTKTARMTLSDGPT